MPDEKSELPQDLQDLSKSIGVDKWKSAPAPKAAPKPTAEPSTPDEPAKPTEKPFLLPGEKEGGPKWYQQAYEGATRGLSGLAATALKYGAYATPLQGAAPEIAEWMQDQPIIQDLQRHADEPDATAWETAGNVASQVAATSAIPGLGAGSLTESGLLALANRLPATYLRGYGMFPSTLSRLLTRYAAPAGKVATGATKGALGGALSDPEHPGTAAAGGAMAGVLPIPAKAAVANRLTKFAARAAVPTVAYSTAVALAHKFGFPGAGNVIASGGMVHLGYIGHRMMHENIRWHTSPIGKNLGMVGTKIVDQFGNLVGSIPSGTAGYFAGPTVGKGMRETPQTIEELGRSLGHGQD